MSGPIVVTDARPNRETFICSKFLPFVGMRLFGRPNADTHGSTPVTASGIVMPMLPTDWLTVAGNTQALAGLEASYGNASPTNQPILTNQIFMLPRHGQLILPVQTILASLCIGIANSSNGNLAYLTSTQLELIKISATGTVTQLATATNSTTYSASASTYTATAVPVTLTLSSQATITSTERLGFRLNTQGYRNASGGNVYHCINANGGSVTAGTAGATTSDIYLRFQ